MASKYYSIENHINYYYSSVYHGNYYVLSA